MITNNLTKYSFYGKQSLENYTYTYRLENVESSQLIKLSSRISKLKGVLKIFNMPNLTKLIIRKFHLQYCQNI